MLRGKLLGSPAPIESMSDPSTPPAEDAAEPQAEAAQPAGFSALGLPEHLLPPAGGGPMQAVSLDTGVVLEMPAGTGPARMAGPVLIRSPGE